MSDSCVTESRYSANLIWETFVSWRLQYLLVVVLLIVFCTCCWRYCVRYWRRRTRDDDDDGRPTSRAEKVSSRISKPKQIRSIKNKKNRAMDSMLSLPNLNKLSSSKLKVSLVVAKENNDTKKSKSTHQPLSNISLLTINGMEERPPKSVSH